MQEQLTGFDGIDMDFRGRSGDEVGCLNLQISVINEEHAYGVNKTGAQPKILTLGCQSLLVPLSGAIL
jgi:hypothetical protein